MAEDVNKSQKKTKICYNVTESVNKVPYRQRISYSESTSLLVKIHCEGQFH